MSYNLKLTGSTLEHSDWLEALEAFASLFSISSSDAEKLMTIAPIVIKPDLSSEKAHALAKLVEDCGLECVVEAADVATESMSIATDDVVVPDNEPDVPVATQTSESKGIFAKLKSIFKRG
ncbi:hypothetical protein [uncultured Umboniibacter sp.]|uniref:hypothetical protein n=1 Tax=uncultured Umboniibacter sp. TaxID=1798917 RepID=UPI0026289AE1|nr:hypothetical protein [uncultured Umboniibacter sp.]